jgi:galactose-1-phosphate uridylyltransferase
VNPHYDGTFLFDNDFPALQPDAPDPGTLILTTLGEEEGQTYWGTSAAESDDVPLSQDPVITPFSKQRLPEEFGNY